MIKELLMTAFKHMDRQDAGITELLKRNEDLDATLQVVVTLSPEEFEAFVRQIDNPPPPTEKLIELLRRKPVWQE